MKTGRDRTLTRIPWSLPRRPRLLWNIWTANVLIFLLWQMMTPLWQRIATLSGTVSMMALLPILIRADDETLLECLVMNADPEHDADCYEFDRNAVKKYRKKMIEAPAKDGKDVLEELIGQRKEEAEDDDMDWEEVLGTIEGGYDNCRFSSYWALDRHMTYPLILAKVQVKRTLGRSLPICHLEIGMSVRIRRS